MHVREKGRDVVSRWACTDVVGISADAFLCRRNQTSYQGGGKRRVRRGVCRHRRKRGEPAAY